MFGNAIVLWFLFLILIRFDAGASVGYSVLQNRPALGILGIIYFGLLYKYLLTPTVPSFNHVRPINLMPFRTITQNLTDSGTPLGHRVFELSGNILLMVPIGIFFGFRLRQFRVWPVLLVGICTSSFFEITQYLRWTWRVADVDDVICNSLGALAAYLLVVYILHLHRSERRRN